MQAPIGYSFIHDCGHFARYFSAEDLRKVASQSDGFYIRSLALTALALLMEVSEGELRKWMNLYCGGDSVLDEVEFHRILKDSQIRAKDSQPMAELTSNDIQSDIEFENALGTRVAGVFVPGAQAGSQTFISNETSERKLREAALAILEDKPVPLVGKSGSRKSSIVDYLHSRVRGGNLVRIHLGDQTDAKSLVGTFTTGKKPGTFTWMAVALTAAVQNGSWVVR